MATARIPCLSILVIEMKFLQFSIIKLTSISLLDAVTNEPVGLQQDDDVTVLNRPAAAALYRPSHSTSATEVEDEI